MTNLAHRPLAESAQSGFRPARAVRPAVTAAEARQRHLRLVHAGIVPGGRRFDDPLPARPGLARRMKTVGVLLAVAATLLLLAAAG